MERKTLVFEAEIKADGDEGVFTGMASTFGNKDLGNDIIQRGAFKRSLQKRPAKRVKLLFQHDSKQPLGIPTEIVETDKGLRLKGKINLEKQIGRETLSDIKFGSLDGLSIGFSVPKGGADFDRDSGVRILKEIDLHEISIVTFPMNELARITSAKFVPRDIPYANVGAGLAQLKALISGEPMPEPEPVTEADVLRSFNRLTESLKT